MILQSQSVHSGTTVKHPTRLRRESARYRKAAGKLKALPLIDSQTHGHALTLYIDPFYIEQAETLQMKYIAVKGLQELPAVAQAHACCCVSRAAETSPQSPLLSMSTISMSMSADSPAETNPKPLVS